MEDYGLTILNGPLSPGMTIAQEALLENDRETVKMIKELCARREFELSLNWITEGNEVKNLLREALSSNATNAVANILELIGLQSTPFIQTATSVKNCFTALAAQHFETLKSALFRNRFVFDTCQVRVRMKFLDEVSREQSILFIDTTDDYLSWENSIDTDILWKKWQLSNEEIVEDIEEDNKSTRIADLKFVCIEDAGKTGMGGILRPLLMKNMPAHIFQTDAVKWIIDYKWRKIWKHRFYRCARFYALRLGLVTAYAIILGGSANISKELTWKEVVASLLVALNFIFGCITLKEEVTQMYNLYEDGREFFGSRGLGIRYYFSSRWNWLDLAFCSLLILFVPTFHVLEMFQSGHWRLLSATAAISTILAYVKVCCPTQKKRCW